MIPYLSEIDHSSDQFVTCSLLSFLACFICQTLALRIICIRSARLRSCTDALTEGVSCVSFLEDAGGPKQALFYNLSLCPDQLDQSIDMNRGQGSFHNEDASIFMSN